MTIVLTAVHRRRLLAAGDRRRRHLVPARGQAPASPAARPRSRPTSRAWRFSRSTASPTTCSSGRCATAAPRTWRRGCATASHRLRRWETDWSSQTGACQAGLLHGSNEDMPAFRWWEKERGAAIVTNHPRDAEELERRHSDGRGLLHADGASRANILSGDAPHSMLTMSTALHRRRPIGRDYAAYFARPYAVAKTIVLVVARRRPRAPRRARRRSAATSGRGSRRSRAYALIRAWATVVQRDLQVAAVVGDILAGRPTIYTTFLAYDEVAHHSGIERADSLAVLRDLDRQIARIARACAEAPRPYRLVVLSDHGQSQGETFRDRYGETLEEVVRAACDAGSVAADRKRRGRRPGLPQRRPDRDGARRHGGRPHGPDGDPAAAIRRRRRARSGRAGRRRATDAGRRLPELSVMASGCLGLVSFPREPGRVSLERLERPPPGPAAGPPPPSGDRLRPRALRAAGRRSCSGRAAPAIWTATGSRARTRSPRSGRTPPSTCAGPTPSPTAPT